MTELEGRLRTDFIEILIYLIIIIIIIIIKQFLTRQMPVSEVLRRGGRYATSQFGLIIKSKCNIEQMCL